MLICPPLLLQDTSPVYKLRCNKKVQPWLLMPAVVVFHLWRNAHLFLPPPWELGAHLFFLSCHPPLSAHWREIAGLYPLVREWIRWEPEHGFLLRELSLKPEWFTPPTHHLSLSRKGCGCVDPTFLYHLLLLYREIYSRGERERRREMCWESSWAKRMPEKINISNMSFWFVLRTNDCTTPWFKGISISAVWRKLVESLFFFLLLCQV